MPLIIDLAGTHGVGKTAVANALTKWFEDLMLQGYKGVYTPDPALAQRIPKSLEIIPSFSSSFGRTELYEHVSNYFQLLLSVTNWGRILSSEKLIRVTTDFGVRSYAYALANPNSSPEVLDVHDKFMKFFTCPVRGSIDAKVCWCYIPIEFEMPSDPRRKVDEVYRRKIDEYILYVYKQYNIDYVTLTGTIEDRLKTLVDYLVFYRYLSF
jgi:hypothetical protein